MKRIFAIYFLLFAITIIFSPIVLAADMRMREQPGEGTIRAQQPTTVPLDNIRRTICPDLAVTDIKFERLEKTDTYEKWLITAIAKNIGKGSFNFTGKLALFEVESGNKKVAEKVFGTVASNGEVRVVYETNSFYDGLYSKTYRAKILYEHITERKSKYELDCDWDNNEMQSNAGARWMPSFKPTGTPQPLNN